MDDDIDIYNMETVMWAVAMRSQPDEDVVILPRLAGSRMDPTVGRRGITSGMGIDATKPFGMPFPDMVLVPGVDDVSFD